MMKKVLALVMVLSMVGFASAALQIEVAGGKAMVTGQLSSDEFLVLSAGDGASLSNFALGAAAPAASYMAAAAADFAGTPAEPPAGFAGEGWFLGVFPNEQYKDGVQLLADLSVQTSQSTRVYEEIIDCTEVPNGKLVRTWTEVTEIVKGALALSFLTADYSDGGSIQNLSLDSSKVVSLTFQDGPCVPEPMTLSLLGLGALLLRRRS